MPAEIDLTQMLHAVEQRRIASGPLFFVIVKRVLIAEGSTELPGQPDLGCGISVVSQAIEIAPIYTRGSHNTRLQELGIPRVDERILDRQFGCLGERMAHKQGSLVCVILARMAVFVPPHRVSIIQTEISLLQRNVDAN